MKYLKKTKLHLKKVENKNKNVYLIALLIYPQQANNAPVTPPLNWAPVSMGLEEM